MSSSLKASNKSALVAAVVVNTAIYISLLNGALGFEDIAEAITDIERLVPSLVGAAAVGILSAQFGPESKARLVFWRWSFPLPGSRAFSEYLYADPRIDSGKIERVLGPLPTAPKEQNALWYKWYRESQADPSISQVHREYLFARDYAALSVLFILVLGGLALWQMGIDWFSLAYISGLVGQYLVVRRAAANHGLRFVTSVMALKATQI